MASAVVSPAGLTLHGAPDACIDDPTKLVPAMHLEMTQDILDELLQSIRNGKPPQLLFGRNPVLKYGETKHVLETRAERFRTELYTSDGKSDLRFAGLMEDRLAVQRAEEVTAKADAALQALKSNMASIKKEKESHKMTMGDDAELLANTKREIPRRVGKGKSVLGGRVGSSYPPSPALGSTATSPLPGSAPTSAPTSHLPVIQQALRIPLLHLLAIKPAKTQDLVRKTRASKENLVSVLPKIARESEADGWKLTDKAFKELDPWKFPYPTQEDRQAAIDNAIKAFDRQRLGSDEKPWQLLLPEEDRGKGIKLSKLSLNKAPVQKTTPSVGPKLLKSLKKEAPKKTKKSEKTEDEKESKGVSAKRVAKTTTGEARKTAAKAAGTAQDKQEKARPVEKDAKPVVKKEPPANGTSSALPKKPPKPRATQQKITERPFTTTKRVQDNKPKNPSPLSASPPVNASDFEDNHPVHKALSASSSHAGKSTPGNSDRTLKRKANDLDHDIHKHDTGVKQRKTTGTTLSTKASATASGDRPIKRKAPDHDNESTRPATKKPAAASKTPKPTQTSTPQYSTASSTTSSAASSRSSQMGHRPLQQRPSQRTPPSPADSASPEPTLTMRQTVDLSVKFKRYYARYQQLHLRLSKMAEITQEQRDEFMLMHNKLQAMKAEIKKGAGVAR
ncbi:uncharacterized protein K452DRAFT_310368 [Aplosporella prunicola CBS 121167]|uniref:Uncharacterized protein n=1 Tax=Aplosporella prunicola CBS 121167 TaxID=1176127 RepID=A0A6A6B9M3_9PEZI|nr:uncharacterized protein K452DRAFT_310368 [Aplosporella prunicola CBS 121167]KAF2140015.1 hypothetical protein K452DRAFT_310368 [Aplosporella prunicola CBS 121167]